jgi:hypothetical protein
MEERMITMIDEIFDRGYQANRAALNAAMSQGLARFGRAVGESFAVLNRIEYSAPWARPVKKARFN